MLLGWLVLTVLGAWCLVPGAVSCVVVLLCCCVFVLAFSRGGCFAFACKKSCCYGYYFVCHRTICTAHAIRFHDHHPSVADVNPTI